MNRKKNCWEYMRCGREPGGSNVSEQGRCPAAVETVHDGVNSGLRGGRFCWAVAGTLCDGKVQGTFAEKRQSCTQCQFYQKVRAEEGSLNIRTKFLKFVRPDSNTAFFRTLQLATIRQGERMIVQGKVLDTAYIIQQGSCIELVEKKEGLYPVGHRGEGDIVGMMSLLTGEAMGFHVEAETDMRVWVIHRSDFESIPSTDPELYAFLTELVADRFDRKGPVADRVIGNYLITDILGRGGYSIVYKGIHTGLKHPVAIKMMRHHLSMQPEFLKTFENEARIISGLNHEHIVSVFDIEYRYKTVFIVYEFLGGASVADLIERMQKIPPPQALSYLVQVLSAMAYAADKGLIHRDINPSNIIVLPDDRVKLIDFGLAGPPGAEDCPLDGNFNYLAPELIDGEPADFRSDIFSLGLTAYHMVTGHLPFSSDDPARRMALMRKADIPDPGEATEDLPLILRRFILTACAGNPDQRFQTPRQAQRFLLEGRAKIEHQPRPDQWTRKQTHFLFNAMSIAARTDIGLKRKTNQDRYSVRSFPDGTVLLAVADGLGGVPGGDIAVQHVVEKLKTCPFPGPGPWTDVLMDFFRQMDKDLAAMIETNEILSGMGTTLIIVAVQDGTAFWVHSGDSRLYHFSDGRLMRITRDQTLARFLAQEGDLAQDQILTHYSSHILEQCIGCRELMPDFGQIRLQKKDRLLLVSDGLYRYVPDSALETVCDRVASDDIAADRLVNMALDAGGADNVTTLIGTVLEHIRQDGIKR